MGVVAAPLRGACGHGGCDGQVRCDDLEDGVAPLALGASFFAGYLVKQLPVAREVI